MTSELDWLCKVVVKVEKIAANLEAGKPLWFDRAQMASQLRAAVYSVRTPPAASLTTEDPR